MLNHKKIINILCLFLITITLTACPSSPDSNPDKNNTADDAGSDILPVDERTTGRINGKVKSIDGEAIEGVAVSIGTHTTVTDNNGFYDLNNISLDAEQLTVDFSKSGYAFNQKVVPVTQGHYSYSVYADMIQHQHAEVINADSVSDAVVAMPDPDDPSGSPVIDVHFPAGAIPASGAVTVSVIRGDPTLPEGRAIFPGEYMGSGSDDPADNTLLESIAFTEITLNDINGNEISEMNQPVTVTIKLPAALQTQYIAGDTIPWWSYDETTASWVREDADPITPEIDDALIINEGGVLFGVAQVMHFSWWNIDKPISEHSCLCAEVIDENNLPVSGAILMADGVTYNGQSRRIATDTQGKACVTVKRSLDSESREKVHLAIEYGGLIFPYSAADDIEGEAEGSPIFKTPTESGSMLLDNPGVCLNVSNPITLNFDGNISGIIRDDSDQPMANLTFFSEMGDEISTDENGEFILSAPIGVAFSLYKPGLFSETIMLTETTTSITINLPNQVPWLQQFEADINRTLNVNETVTLTAIAIDPEDGELSYQWEIDGGYSLNVSEEGNSATFTAPSGGTDTALVTLTLTDNKGAETITSKPIAWGSEGDSYTLKLIILDNAKNNTPLEGVVVVLHDAITGAITERRTSDTLGVVDFGYIGSHRATYSVLYSHTKDCKELYAGSDYLNTFVNVPVGSHTYYVKHFIKAIPSYEYASLCPPNATLATFDITLNQIPLNSSTSLRPFTSLSGTGEVKTGSGTVRQSNLNDNGELDIIALAKDADFNPIAYDVLLDQTIVEGQHYNYELTLNNALQATPLVIEIPALAELNPGISIRVEKDGQSLFLDAISTVNGNGETALIPIMDDYRLTEMQANYGGGFGHLLLEKKHHISSPTITITNSGLSSMTSVPLFQDNTFIWSGEKNHDFTTISMNMVCDINYEKGVVWSVLMDKQLNQWKAVEPPAEVSMCLNMRDKIGGYDGEVSGDHYVELTFVDLDITLSKDDLWNTLINGGDISELWQQRVEIYHDLSGPEYAP